MGVAPRPPTAPVRAGATRPCSDGRPIAERLVSRSALSPIHILQRTPLPFFVQVSDVA